MDYQKISPKIIEKIEQIVDRKNVLTSTEDIQPYSHDETPGLSLFPEAVVKIENQTQLNDK